MRAFLDTNVLIDVVMDRQPWVNDALVLFELANQGKLSLVAADLSFINIAYITRKMLSKADLYTLLTDLREFVKVIEMGEAIIDNAIKAQWNDMEVTTTSKIVYNINEQVSSKVEMIAEDVMKTETTTVKCGEDIYSVTASSLVAE